MFFLPYWSNKAMSMLHYSSGKGLKDSTHVFVKAYHKKQNTVYSGIVPICYVEDSGERELHAYIEYKKK